MDKPQEIPGLRDAGEELLRELERLREGLVVGADSERVVLERVPGDRNGLEIVERPDTYELECALDPSRARQRAFPLRRGSPRRRER